MLFISRNKSGIPYRERNFGTCVRKLGTRVRNFGTRVRKLGTRVRKLYFLLQKQLASLALDGWQAHAVYFSIQIERVDVCHSSDVVEHCL